MDPTDLSIISPVYNEAGNIELFLSRLLSILNSMQINHFEIILVDDASTDQSVPIIKKHLEMDSRIKLICFSRNFGQQSALFAGILKSRGTIIINMDSDLQHPVEEIPLMLSLFKKQNLDILFTSKKDKKGQTFFLRIFSGLFYKMMGFMTDCKIPLDASDFRIFNNKVKQFLLDFHEFHIYIPALLGLTGFKSDVYLYEVSQRFAGKSSFSLRSLFLLAVNALFSFTHIPVKISIFLGFLSLLISTGYTLFTIFKWLIYGVVIPGYITLILFILFFNSVILINLGLINEYVFRIFSLIQNRPNYIISEEYNIK